ncbi:MAG: hypothetical protein QOG82_1495 [Actinomycetota bacterium]|nr:hypothetical protein [Actinomycetota bacterium]
MARELVGRVVVVGIERADVARRLAAEGATVVVVGDDAEAAGVLLAEIEAAGAGRAAYFRLGANLPAPGEEAAPDHGAPSSGPTGSALDGLVEFVAGTWPAR